MWAGRKFSHKERTYIYDTFRGAIAAHERIYPTRTSVDNKKCCLLLGFMPNSYVVSPMALHPTKYRPISHFVGGICTLRTGTYEFFKVFTARPPRHSGQVHHVVSRLDTRTRIMSSFKDDVPRNFVGV